MQQFRCKLTSCPSQLKNTGKHAFSALFKTMSCICCKKNNWLGWITLFFLRTVLCKKHSEVIVHSSKSALLKNRSDENILYFASSLSYSANEKKKWRSDHWKLWGPFTGTARKHFFALSCPNAFVLLEFIEWTPAITLPNMWLFNLMSVAKVVFTPRKNTIL